ncbi:MAG: M48 family metallopeptidase [Spongiibacteraceae bacterium]|jgi:predicted Zn-dependent protease|nr:M48 family metallopeptidase [Spongiibacteraceae bacterium]
MRKILLITLVAALLAACATSPTGRRQLMMFPENELNQMGIAAYEEIKQKQPLSKDAAVNGYVACVAQAVLSQLPGDEGQGWEINVFQDDSPNAFALPGKKIGIHTGILKAAVNQDQLAAVIGHEIGHVQARHSGERLSVQTTAGAAGVLAAILVGSDSPEKQLAIAALGAGATYGIILPFSRTQESESDTIGLRLMAQAGFDPEESVRLWQNMASLNEGAAPPEFLSTHPASETRMRRLSEQMADVMPLYEQARARGIRPNCKR